MANNKRKRNGNNKARKKSKSTNRGIQRPKPKFVKGAARSRSNTFTQKVQRVLSKNKPTGNYTKTYTGNLTTLNDNTYTFHSRVSRETTALLGSDFLFFDVRKILDAVSVLFNGKPTAMNGYLTPGNMDDKTTKFRLQYASVAVTFKNITDITWDCEFWAIDNKHQDAATFDSDYTAALTNLNQVGGTTSLITKIGVQPSQIPQLAKNYHMKKIKKTLKPGYSYTYFTSIADRIIDYIQYYEGDQLQFFQKFSKQLTMRCKPTMSSSFNTVGGNVGYFSGDAGQFDHPFMVEVTEKYKLDCPDDVPSEKENDSWAWFTDLPARKTGEPNGIRGVENINFREANNAQKTF